MPNCYKALRKFNFSAEKWTKNMWGTKYEFRNPLKQNYGHVKTLQQLLNLPMGNFIPIVVFSNSAHISVQTDKAVITLFHQPKTITKG
ncbi:MAG: NERD domain-containing protein [Muribaculaceae bacterium]|nr:NERD domain-containing protein [Muribaculaceae bacterium]